MALAVRTRLFSRTVTAAGVTATDSVWVAGSAPAWNGAATLPPLMFVHGATYTTDITLNYAPQHARMLNALAQYFTVYVADFNGDLWGNPEHTARIEDARTHLSNVWGAAGPVTVVGVSMGGLGALNYAKQYPGNVRGVLAFTPVINLQRFRNEAGGGPAAIDPRYPGGYSDATYGATRNPAVWASTLPTSIPVSLMYSPADTLIPVDTITDFKEARPTNTYVTNVGNGGHAESSIDAAQAQIIRFCRVLGT